jgi:CubicO group peptidase (beta-lactamase class C family)
MPIKFGRGPGFLFQEMPGYHGPEMSPLRCVLSVIPGVVLAAVLPSRVTAADDGRFEAARRVLEEAIAARAFPGCAAAVGTSRGVVWRQCLGRFDYEGGSPVTPDSLYDLASLTKVVGTTSVCLALVRDGRLAPGDAVARHLPEAAALGQAGATIEHLLTHSSGLPAWLPLYREARGYADVLRLACAAGLESPPGRVERYSDLGFILLGGICARAGGQPLPRLEEELVFRPLGMRSTLRNPPAAELARVVPTEKRLQDGAGGANGALTVTTRGVVHDENAAAGDGVTGHAGLFSTADDLGLLAAELLRGLRGESRVFPRDLLAAFTARRGLVPGSSRALGWDKPTNGGSAGRFLGQRAFGHTGFTGTSMWIDAERDLFIILLTNRVHPTRENQKIAGVRRAFADAAVLGFERRIRRL